MAEQYDSRRTEILKMKKDGLNDAQIGRKLGISRQRIGQILNGIRKRKPSRNPYQALLSTAQVAKILNIHPNTVRKWSNEMILPSYRIGLRGDRRFRRDDIEEMLREGYMK